MDIMVYWMDDETRGLGWKPREKGWDTQSKNAETVWSGFRLAKTGGIMRMCTGRGCIAGREFQLQRLFWGVYLYLATDEVQAHQRFNDEWSMVIVGDGALGLVSIRLSAGVSHA